MDSTSRLNYAFTEVIYDSILNAFQPLEERLTDLDKRLSSFQTRQNELMTREELRDYLKCSFPSVKKFVDEHGVQPVKIGRQIRYYQSEIDAALNATRTSTNNNV